MDVEDQRIFDAAKDEAKDPIAEIDQLMLDAVNERRTEDLVEDFLDRLTKIHLIVEKHTKTRTRENGNIETERSEALWEIHEVLKPLL